MTLDFFDSHMARKGLLLHPLSGPEDPIKYPFLAVAGRQQIFLRSGTRKQKFFKKLCFLRFFTPSKSGADRYCLISRRYSTLSIIIQGFMRCEELLKNLYVEELI